MQISTIYLVVNPARIVRIRGQTELVTLKCSIMLHKSIIKEKKGKTYYSRESIRLYNPTEDL